MTLAEQVYTQSLLMAGELEPKQERLLKTLCDGITASLSAKLRPGLTPEDCKADFIAAASLYALATLSAAMDPDRVEQLQAGELTIRRRDAEPAVKCLQNQADLMIAPYLKDRFSFLGV